MHNIFNKKLMICIQTQGLRLKGHIFRLFDHYLSYVRENSSYVSCTDLTELCTVQNSTINVQLVMS